jgi:hypothetical protein
MTTPSVELVTLQSLDTELGAHRAIRSCAPVTFYMLLKAYGYLPDDLTPAQFIKDIDKDRLSTDFDMVASSETMNWSRPQLSQYLRETYGATIVSWQFVWNFIPTDLGRMKQAGYIITDQEIQFYFMHVWGKTVKEIVQSGYPVIATMEPGFGENKNVHSVIVTSWDEYEVGAIEPDARNPYDHFTVKRFMEYLSPLGAGSIVLPKNP